MTAQSHDPGTTDRAALRDRIAQAIHADLISTAYRRDGGLLSIVPRLADAVLAVLPEPADRSALLREAADELGRMDYDTDSSDYGYDTYRDAWNGGVMDGVEKLRRMADEEQHDGADGEEDELVCVDMCGSCDACGMEPFGTPAEGWREAARFLRRTARTSGNRQGALHGARLIEAELRRVADEKQPQPISEAEAAATLARECTDHAAVILWCADRVRSVDDDPAVQDAADYLHSLSTRAQVDTTPVTDRAAIIRWCAQEIHSMGGDHNVEKAAEYLDDLATKAAEATDE